MVLELETGQRCFELTRDVRLALLMSISSGSSRLRDLLRLVGTILCAQMSLQGSAEVMDTALTTSTTL